MADAITQKAPVQVGFVLAPALANGSQICGNIRTALRSGEDEQRGSRSVAGRFRVAFAGSAELQRRINPRLTSGPGATQELQQHGLRLIVLGAAVATQSNYVPLPAV